MSLRAVSRLVSISLLAIGPSVALANTAGEVSPSLRAAIEKATYRIEPARKAGANSGYVASNRAQGMKLSFASSGVLVSGASSGERWKLGMNLKSWGYGNKTRSVRSAKLAVSGDRIEYRRGQIVEWYSNSRAGLEQGFTVQAPPPAVRRSGALRLHLALSGDLTPSLAEEGAGLLLARAGGERVLQFAGLKAFDAAGRSLPSRMELQRTDLTLVVDDSTAVYPVTVDPLLTKETKLTASEPMPLDEFGWSVALSGDTAVVGARGNAEVGAGDIPGSAYVFVRNGGGWSQQQKLTPSDAVACDEFGHSVAVSGDTAVVSAPTCCASAGSAYVFVRSAGVWSQQQKLTASDGATCDFFGNSVAVIGDMAVVGAPGNNGAGDSSGAAYVYVRSETVWSQQQRLAASDAAAGDGFGASVAVSEDTAVVGSPADDGPGDTSGSAYVFVRSGGAWSQQQKIRASDVGEQDLFGFSVVVSGDTAVVASPFHSDAGTRSGAAYVFVRSAGIWSQQQKLTAGDAAAFDEFGWSVALSGETVAVGSPGDGAAGDGGSAYLFVRSAGVWSQQQKLTPSDGAPGLVFGGSVAVGGNMAVVGTQACCSISPGAAYVYEPASALLSALSPARVWVGLKNSDDAVLRLDLLAEVLIDATKVGQGELDNVFGGSSGFSNALLNTIPLSLTGGPVSVPSGAQLSIKVSARRTCVGAGHVSGTARLWYDGKSVDTGASRDAGSRFGATIGETASDYFLRGASALSTTAGSSRTSADVFVNSSAPCPARPFTTLGTWSRTLP